MYTNILAGIVLSVLLGICFIIYMLPFKKISKDIFILFLIITQIISIFFLFYTPYNTNNENFYFEVSPERKKCLMEQVSLDIKPGQRSKNCCPSYTVGGKLPVVSEWEHSKNPINWDRTDNHTTSDKNNAYSTQLAPTNLVK